MASVIINVFDLIIHVFINNTYSKQFDKMKSLKNIRVRSSVKFCFVFLLSILYAGHGFATVYNVTNTTDGLALNQLRGAILDADAAGGSHTINVAAGTYTLTLGQIVFGNTNQTINIIGAGAATTIIDMTAGAGQDRIFFINPSGTTNSPVISISGLTFQNGYLNSDFYGGAAICAGGGEAESLTVTNCIFTNNILPANAYGGGAICLQVRGDLSVDNCTFTNNVSNDADGGAILFIVFNSALGDGFGTLSVTNSTFTNNSVVFPGAGSSNGGAMTFTGQGGVTTFNATITNNTFVGNSTDGYGGAILANNSPNLSIPQIHYNRFYNNTSAASDLSSGLHFAESSGSVNAENNWWGCNTNPVNVGSTAPCNQAGGDVPGGGSLDANPWLQLKVTASPNPICNTPAGLGNTSTVTASFLNNSDGTAIPVGNLSRLIGLPVTWTSTLGSLSAQQLTIQASGTATALFTSNGTGGTATVNAQVDNVPSTEASPARANITVNTIPIVSNPANVTSCVGGTAMFISTITGTPAPSIQWYIGTTALVNGVQGSGSTVSGATTNTLTITNVQPGDAAINYNVRATNQCGEDTSANATLFVNQVTGGTVGSDQTICSGGDPAAFTESLASTGSGLLTYQWQSSTTNCATGFGDIGSATGTTYDPPSGLTVTTYYRRVTTSTLNGVPCTANSNCITVTVNQVAGGIVGSNQSLCNPGDPAALTEFIAAFGSGALTYQWQSSTTDCNTGFSDIGSETGISYDPPSGLTVTTYYRRVATSTLNGVPCTANSNCITVTINPDNTITLTSAPGTDAQTVLVNTPITPITYATTGATGATFSGLPPGVNGNWAGDVVTINGSPTSTGVYNYTVTLTGGCGVVTANGTITVNLPCTPPTFSQCPNNIIVNTDPLTCAATVSYTATATGDPVPTLSYVFSGATSGSGGGTGTGSSFNKGVTTVTITATNGCVPDATCSFTITVNDTEKPVINCPANITDNVIPGTCGKVIFYTVTASDNCPGVTTSLISGSGSGQIFPVGTTTETWMATDASGNTSTCSFTVTIIDNQNPIITGCPSPIVKNTDPGICTTTATWVAPTASDNCPGVSMTSNYAPGATFPKGVTTVTYTATDASNNTTICTFTVTVNDIELPVISNCPNNITVNAATDLCSATVTWTEPTASDNCMVSSFNKTPAGNTFNVGTTSVTYTATDMSGNTKTCSFTVTVVDIQSPKITCPGNAMRGTAEGTCKYTINATEFDATATDNCNIAPPLTYTYTGPTSGSGNTSLNGVMLNKGLYTITWKATDVNGNMNTCSFTVDVKDNELPKITCPADKTVVTSPGLCTASVALGSPTVSDNCGVQSTTNNAPNPFPVGMTIVTWTVTDVNGNTKTCTQKVTVIPYSCGAPTQVLHSDTTATTAKIKWKVGKCATSYQVRLRQELTPGVWGAWSAWVTFSGPAGPPQWTHQFTGLNPNKFHNSQVRSVCGSSFSASINDWWWTLPSFAPIEDRIASEENESQELPVNIAFIPNPAREFTTVMIEGFEQKEKTITMFDLYGKLVFTVKVDANQNLLELDLDALNARTGMYLIRVSDDRKQKTEQLMIER
jgi:hypothetical protein